MTTIRLLPDTGLGLRAPRATPVLVAVLRRAAWIARWPSRVLAARRVLADLSRMNDRELSDIGLARQDLRDATGLPMDSDPSRLLARRADARGRR